MRIVSAQVSPKIDPNAISKTEAEEQKVDHGMMFDTIIATLRPHPNSDDIQRLKELALCFPMVATGRRASPLIFYSY